MHENQDCQCESREVVMKAWKQWEKKLRLCSEAVFSRLNNQRDGIAIRIPEGLTIEDINNIEAHLKSNLYVKKLVSTRRERNLRK